ncbi:uncharacterized protein I206_106481 [Kwoniella pini CBS 10737]|uniref:sulfiredoxin n=1 Tax=Kwoniella pini CBS 10737 TaxID=1296096 RepID=A0A1B9HUF3_9TREE|nr:sulfiredoxin [Kwoniella pini CBS 10737]OCF46899.1 sulfiredoxin [Kwoniella pini CBS 10737]
MSTTMNEIIPSSSSSSSCLPEQLQPAKNESSSSSTSLKLNDNINEIEDKPKSSIFSRNEESPIHNVPMKIIRRPLPSELDENKVLKFMKEMKDGDTFTPIEIIKVKSTLKSNPNGPKENFYFSMGGCHRFEATKRLNFETIRAKIIEVPPSQMRIYLGAGSPF